jgi:glutathione S-transferase
MLRIWGRKTSSNVQALMWAVGELRLPYERYDIGHRYGGTDTPAFLAMNPNGTVPVLRDDDGPPLWETGAILRYLCHRYGAAPFWPADLATRTEIDMWAEWAKINVTLAFTAPVFWRIVRTAPAHHDHTAIRTAMQKLSTVFDVAEARLADRSYLAGETVTVADIQFGHVLYRYYDIDVTRPEHPAIRRYYERLTQRAAFRDHVMVSYEDLRVT